MRYINVDDDYVKSVFKANSLEESTPIQESKAVDTESQEVIEEAEEHVCPLCETELSEAISASVPFLGSSMRLPRKKVRISASLTKMKLN